MTGHHDALASRSGLSHSAAGALRSSPFSSQRGNGNILIPQSATVKSMVAPSHIPLHLALLLFAIPAAVGSATGAVGVSSGGQLWCVAKNNAEDGALQSAIDWTCGPNGGADCRAIQQGGACYEPPDLQAHASYAFNDYFLRSGGAASPTACDFSGAAALTALNPSHGSCVFPSSASPKNGSFVGTTTYGRTGGNLSQSSSWQLNLWSLLLCIFLSVIFFVVSHL